MKRLGLVLGLAGLLVGANLALAGDYHTGGTLICADCHVMHYSQSHGYNDNGTGIYVPLGAGGPFTYLLRAEVNDLCLSCHDNQAFAPDVLADNTTGIVRLAGGLNRDGVAPYYHSTGHTLDATDAAPGGTWSNPGAGLECNHCHSQHGSTVAYRNLRSKTGTATANTTVDYAIGTNDLAKDVFERSATMGGNHYDWTNVDYNEPDQTKSDYATFCQGCHTNFHGAEGGPEVGGSATGEWVRHPNADADIGALGGGHSSYATWSDPAKPNKVKVLSASGTWPATDNTPSCMSCHKAHGNQNAFGLIHMKGTGTLTEQGDDGNQVKDLCKQCHRQG